MADLQLASHCRKLVHGKSGFVEIIQEAMLEHQDEEKSVEFIYMDNQQAKGSQPKLDPSIRVDDYLDAIRQKNKLSDT